MSDQAELKSIEAEVYALRLRVFQLNEPRLEQVFARLCDVLTALRPIVRGDAGTVLKFDR